MGSNPGLEIGAVPDPVQKHYSLGFDAPVEHLVEPVEVDHSHLRQAPGLPQLPPQHGSLNPVQLCIQPRCDRSEEHTSELQSRPHLVCRLLLEKKKKSPG